MRRQRETVRASAAPGLPTFTNAMGAAVLELPIHACEKCGTELVDAQPMVHCPRCGYSAPRGLP